MTWSDVERFRKRARKSGLVNCVADTMESLRRDDPPATETDDAYLKKQAMSECLKKCAR
jgi:hypothetical protein